MKKIITILILLLTINCFAANEVHLGYSVGSNLYFRVFNQAGSVWNGSAFETWADGNVGTYDVALTGTGGSFYVGNFPTLSDGNYSVIAYLQAGGSPAVADGVISGATMIWLANEEVTLSDLLLDLGMPRSQAGNTQR